MEMKIALGPLAYCWPRERILEFYRGAALAPVDIVYLGEVVCSRRRELRLEDWLRVGRELAAAGKQVVLSTQALIESESDLKLMRRIAGNGEFMVEANGMGAVHLLAGKVPFVAGLHLNAYNAQTLELFARWGACRWVFPLELSRDALAELQRHKPASLATEVLVYGRLPLALSARCFTARHYNSSKDNCEFRCVADGDGIALNTGDGERFLTLNGIQVQSGRVQSLMGEIAEVGALGVEVLRVSPQWEHTFDVIALLKKSIAGTVAPSAAAEAIAALAPDAVCNGYWHARSGMDCVASSSL
jgi:O2-independent ubiquinone biosynthesis protein UbiV